MSLLRCAVIALTLVAPTAAWAGCGGSMPVAQGEPSAKKTPKLKRYVENLDAARAAKLLAEKPNVVVLDVRTPEEFAAGHLANATNIDVNADDFGKRIGALDREAEYLVYCGVGARSAVARDQMIDLGFRHLSHLEGGLQAWEAAGLPATKP